MTTNNHFSRDEWRKRCPAFPYWMPLASLTNCIEPEKGIVADPLWLLHRPQLTDPFAQPFDSYHLLSSLRAKRAGLKGLCAESAWAITGRQCPQSAHTPKLLLPPVRIRLFGPKTAKLGPKYAFWSFSAKYWHFGPFRPMPVQKTMQTRCLGVFPLYGYQNFCFLQ